MPQRRFWIRSTSRPIRSSTASVITSWNIASRASEASGRRRSSASRTAGRSFSGLPWSSNGFQICLMNSSTKIFATALECLRISRGDVERGLGRDPERGELGARPAERGLSSSKLPSGSGRRIPSFSALRSSSGAASPASQRSAELLGGDDLRLLVLERRLHARG